MKKIALLLIIAASILVSCDKIEGPYYVLIHHEDVDVEFPDLDTSTVYKKVLIEEFTGHRCTNCPAGHTKLSELHQQYGDTLVMVGIHATTLAKPSSKMPYDFRTDEGTELTDFYGISAIPCAIINRQLHPGGWGVSEWQSQIQNYVHHTPSAAIQMINQFNKPSQNNLKANIKVTMLEDYVSTVKLALLLVEDGVVKPQMLADGSIDSNYVHSHVLRAFINGTYGDYLTETGRLYKGEAYTYAYSIDFSGHDWDPAKCSVVAILYDASFGEGGVLQVESIPVLSNKNSITK